MYSMWPHYITVGVNSAAWALCPWCGKRLLSVCACMHVCVCVCVCVCVYKYVIKHVCIHGFSLDVPRRVLHTQESTTFANVKNVLLTFCSVYTTS